MLCLCVRDNLERLDAVDTAGACQRRGRRSNSTHNKIGYSPCFGGDSKILRSTGWDRLLLPAHMSGLASAQLDELSYRPPAKQVSSILSRLLIELMLFRSLQRVNTIKGTCTGFLLSSSAPICRAYDESGAEAGLVERLKQ